MALIGDSSATRCAESFLALWRDNGPTIEAQTSGSTGAPKMISLPKADMRLSAKATCAYFGINHASLLFLPLSVDYIAGKMMLVRAEVSGANVMVETPSNRPLLAPPPAEIDLAAVVPPQIHGLLKSPWHGRIRNLIVGGAPLDSENEQALVNRGINAYATYGMTETSSHVALRRLGTDIYKALPHVTFSIDTRGCLVIHSSAMQFDTLVTNDLVELVGPDSFRWLGRHDNVINSGGIKVSPEVIEQKLSTYIPDNREFFISSRPSRKWGREVVLVIEGRDPMEEPIDFAAIPTLSKAERPKATLYITRFDRTRTGKIIRPHALPETNET